MASNNKMVWVDIETTGLDPNKDVILELGIIVTDPEGKIESAFSSLVLGDEIYDEDLIHPDVIEMHRNSGLWDDVRYALSMRHVSTRTMDKAEVEEAAITFLQGSDVERGTVPMCGSSVHFDRSFLLTHMRKLHDYFHYRNLDTSTLKNVCKLVNSPVAAAIPNKREIHRAIYDLEDSIAEYRFYLDNLIHVAI